MVLQLESSGITFACNFMDYNRELVYGIVMEMIMFVLTNTYWGCFAFKGF